VRLSQKKNKNKTDEVEEYLPRMFKVLGSMSNIATKKERKRFKGTYLFCHVRTHR
jgi:hypothetical protein